MVKQKQTLYFNQSYRLSVAFLFCCQKFCVVRTFIMFYIEIVHPFFNYQV